MSDRSHAGNFEHIQNTLGYRFKDIRLLHSALIHKSYAHEMHLEQPYGNERLEYLGDAVLELVVSHILMERCRNCSEGMLSKMRAAVVNTGELAARAEQLELGDALYLGRGEEEGRGRHKRSILANAYEAVVAAVYYDGGYEAAFRMIELHFEGIISEVMRTGFFNDYKSRLQEYCQRTYNAVPHYMLLNAEGPDHVKHFETQVVIDNTAYATGHGRSKKSAEQEAARKTLLQLTEHEP